MIGLRCNSHDMWKHFSRNMIFWNTSNNSLNKFQNELHYNNVRYGSHKFREAYILSAVSDLVMVIGGFVDSVSTMPGNRNYRYHKYSISSVITNAEFTAPLINSRFLINSYCLGQAFQYF